MCSEERFPHLCLPNTMHTHFTADRDARILLQRSLRALGYYSLVLPTPCVAFLVPSTALSRNKGFMHYCARGRREWAWGHRSREAFCYCGDLNKSGLQDGTVKSWTERRGQVKY